MLLSKDHVVEDPKAKSMEPIMEKNSKIQSGKNGNLRSVWKPKKDNGVKINNKSVKGAVKAKNKESTPHSNSRADLPLPYSIF